MTNEGCPNRECRNFGKQCWVHCLYCGKDILWKPKGMDFNVKYNGPRPLDPDTGEKHNCKEEEMIQEPEGQLNPLAYFLHHGYPSLGRHYTKAFYNQQGIQQMCGNGDCICYKVKMMAWDHPDIAEEWNRQRAEWLKQWPDRDIDYGRYMTCAYCENRYKRMSYSIKGVCDNCYWQKVWENGGIPFTPFGYDYSSIEGMSS